MNSIFPPSFSQPLQASQSKAAQLANQLMDSTTMVAQFGRRFEQLLRTEKYYDCVFHIAGAQLKCHKLILSTASPVFEAMFYGPLREQQQEIEILDISAETFQMLLNYIYAGVIDFETLSLEEAIELYYCAEKYLITDLTNTCLLAIARKLRYTNILPALELCVCMDLRDLLEVCMSFFTRCCLNNLQFMTSHKNHYVHVSKECIKAIIAANGSEKTRKQLLWFVYEWCQHECHELGLEQENCALIINDLQLPTCSAVESEGDALKSSQQQKQQCNLIERIYFKACRPFTVTQDSHEWTVFVKCNRFIALRGLIICSRLTPNLSPLTHYSSNVPSDYSENLYIEVLAPTTSANDQHVRHSSGSDDESEESDLDHNAEIESVIWQHNVTKQLTRYNCDMNIEWGEGLLLTPDIEYKIRLVWRTDAYGSEYPCSLQSDVVNGVSFRDVPMQSGSLVKGLRFTNLV
ncbi:BTB/POZ domain-containing protein 3 [Anastrepha obliqua]|uniref:BTB/POZ domain-containing protein 3 n=1 Tax=Anastrepha obliqua TaxID=95512 RepID=UPI0024090AD2|nr:BTB/POZ domain-containing protein 3 [Anastrepha obliqua]XP_054737029.1 BTB/POZ domain-containing protein 3 [Anastrepha obliqua]XP_054737030.1 BTB/POZ domain-containing protein 3 [Anastrepha obliqua]XP_054737031.1 BTB/POZ domain-containing protein 3 [Anastrepha obliqua]XP_054737032.1 BTB/POZ domain-containing protein 3 [Anastrepha obliqua]